MTRHYTRAATWPLMLISLPSLVACGSSPCWTTSDALNKAHQYWLPACNASYSCPGSTMEYHEESVCIPSQADCNILRRYTFESYARNCEDTLICMDDSTFTYEAGDICTQQTQPPG